MTKHADKRMQQRGIPEEVILFIKENGKSINTHGVRKYFFNKGCYKKIQYQKDLINFVKKFDKQIFSTAIVCDQNTCITAMKINTTQRLHWN